MDAEAIQGIILFSDNIQILKIYKRQNHQTKSLTTSFAVKLSTYTYSNSYFFNKIKDAIIVTMATIKPKTLDAVSQVTSVLKKATEQLEEVSLASQVCC